MRLCHILDRNISYQTHLDIEPILQTWNDVIPENHHLNGTELSVFQGTKPLDVSFAYLLIEKENEIIGVVYLQLINFNPNHYDQSVLNNSELKILKPIILKKSLNLLFCGNVFKIGHSGYYFKNQENNGLIFQIIDHFQKHNQMKINFRASVIKDLEGKINTNEAKEAGMKPYENDLLMELLVDPSWNSFDDYLAGLSKKYLQRAHKIINAVAPVESRNLSLDQISHYSVEIEKLYNNVVLQQKIRMGRLNGRYFFEMKKAYQHNFQMVGYFLGQNLVAFSCYIFSENKELEIHYIGLDYGYNEQFKLYFNILFDGIDMAIKYGIRTLKFGRTSYDAKASVGAKPKAALHYFKVKRGLPTLIYRYLSRWNQDATNETWKIRNPFKTVPEQGKALITK